jgi:phospholipase/lecithinase/hemolysin
MEDIVRTLRTVVFSVFALVVVAFPLNGNASSFSSVIVYGDSLSDNGNLFAATGLPPAPYYNGRFSNGPVSVEQLAVLLGAPLIDYAFGGATTGLGNEFDNGSQTKLGTMNAPGMLTELAAFPPPAALIPTSLFVVWGGANDLEIGGSVTTAVADIDTIVGALEAKGATHILVPGLPDLGLTPEFLGNATATAYSLAFNAGLKASLPSNVTYFDTYGLLNAIVANPGAYGFTNVTAACFDTTHAIPTLCADPSKYLFWDDIHPTTAADAILAKQFDATVTPEPSSLLLLGSGFLAGVAELVRRRRAA